MVFIIKKIFVINKFAEIFMYSIYVGNTKTEKLELLYSFSKDEVLKLFKFIDMDGIKFGFLEELRDIDGTVNFFCLEIPFLKEAFEYYREIMNETFLDSLINACNVAIEKKLELICYRE
jgi:hypothetical protein